MVPYNQQLDKEKLDKGIKTYLGDLNDIDAKGIEIVYTGTETTNKPEVANGYCITLATSVTYKKQIYYNQTDTNVSFERTCNNGIWTEWVSKQQTITSGTEYETGRIIDGNKEFGLRKNLGALPNSTNTTYNTGLSNSYKIKKYQLFAKNRGSEQLLSIPFINLHNTVYISGYLDNANLISLKTNDNFSGYDLIIEVYYTKN